MWRIVVLALSVLFAGVAYSKEHPNPETTETKKAPEDEQRGSDKSPFTVKVLPTPDAEAKAAKEEGHRQEKASDDKWIMRSTVWLAFVTTILAGVTTGLWVATYRLASDAKNAAKRQAREMKISLGIAKRSANAATKAADAAERTVNTMKDIAERQLRAYVSVATAEIHDLTAGFTPRAHLVVRNSGQTPAYDLIGISGMAMAVSWDALTPPSSEPIEVTATSLAAGAPTDQFISAPRPLKAGEREALIDGSKTLWVYGKMRYRDTFKVERITEYRFQVGGKAGLSGNRMAICPEGNRET